MPELPEVEHLRRTLEPRLAGRTVEQARLLRRDMLVVPGDPLGGFSRSRSSGARPRRATSRHLLGGAKIEGIERRGKHLAIRAQDGRILAAHLGMTGAFLIEPEPTDHIHASWRLDDGTRLVFRDPRRFGGLWFFPDAAERDEKLWSRLGSDALTITAGALARALSGRRTPIKSALLDQHTLAGVGNIYADEALFLSGVHPTATASEFGRGGPREPESKALAAAIRRLLRAAIERGGASIRSYVDANGQTGRSQLTHRVYGRGGEPCVRCGSELQSATVAQRTTVWCPQCQT